MSADLVILLGAVFVAAFASGLAGFAFNLIAASILFHWMDPQALAPVLVMGSLLIQLGTLRGIWHAISWRGLVPYLAGGVLGTPVGIAILAYGNPSGIVFGIGLLLVFYGGYGLARMALRRAPRPFAAGRAVDAGIGFAGGILGGIGGFSGALPAMWGDLQGLRKDDARAIFQPFIVAMQTIAALGLAAKGILDAASLITLVTILPALALGAWLGMHAYRLIPPQGFRIVLLGLLFVSGLSLVI